MARSSFRARTLLTASLLAVPAVYLVGACSSNPEAPAIQMTMMNFGDSGTGKPDATVKKPHDAGHDAAKDVSTHDAVAEAKGPQMGDTGTGDPCTANLACASGICSTGPVIAGDAAAAHDAGKHDGGKGDGGINCAAGGCTCQAATCDDGVQNEGETDIDCGGTKCKPCMVGETCKDGADCKTGVCGGVYAGASCPVSGHDAGAATDAASTGGACTCSVPSCDDGVKNGNETDIDCGGGTCPACTTGKNCDIAGDCVSTICTAGMTGSQCACPVGMAEASTNTGAPYCIDSVEVTFGQYQAFLNKSVPVTMQSAECSWNQTFEPIGLASTPAGVFLNNPVTNVNWCDAEAFCTYANTYAKHLCGSIADASKGVLEGAPVTNNGTDNNNEAVDEWYNACSGQGVNVYPYGDQYNPLRCNGIDSPAQNSTGPVEVPPGNAIDSLAVPGGVRCIFDSACNNPPNPLPTVYATPSAQLVSCHGGQPADGGVVASPGCIQAFIESGCNSLTGSLFDMSGNVAEWENSCTGTAGATDTCRVRGGSYDSSPGASSLTCQTGSSQPPLARNTTASDIGFRCCL